MIDESICLDQFSLPSATDFTVCWKKSDTEPPRLAGLIQQGSFSVDDTITVRYKGIDCPRQARIFACRCNANQDVSATFRLLGEGTNPESTIIAPQQTPEDWRYGEPNPAFLYQADDVCNYFAERLYENQRGLVVISGATNSAKSVTARGIVLKLLGLTRWDERVQGKKWPHLVTCEDPLEEWNLIVSGTSVKLCPEKAQDLACWFTSRSLSKAGTEDPKCDVQSLEQATLDSLRQSVWCFFYGEVRKDDDWRHLLFLAGTGHLVVTTTHAGSLTETLQRLFAAAHAKTEADRGMVMAKVRAVAHLAAIDVDHGAAKARAILASCWLHSTKALSAIVSDGLSSIVPNDDFVIGKGQFRPSTTGMPEQEHWEGLEHSARTAGCLEDIFRL